MKFSANPQALGTACDFEEFAENRVARYGAALEGQTASHRPAVLLLASRLFSFSLFHLKCFTLFQFLLKSF